jgi:tripartite-type tricarboxylate transporter receptor subunit TctC
MSVHGQGFLLLPAPTRQSSIGLAEVPKALKQPKVREVLASSGAEAVASTPVEFQNFIVKEIDKWGSIIEASNLQ